MDIKVIDTNTYGFIVNNIKLLNPDVNEEIIKFYIDKVVKEITIKTNRVKFPSDLKYLVIDLVNDTFAINKMNTNSQEAQSIKSMTEQDRKVDFGIDSYSQTRFNLLLQQKLEDNQKLINRYRLLYKVVEKNAEN